MIRKEQIVAVSRLLALCGSVWAVEVNGPVAHWKFDEDQGRHSMRFST